MSAKGRGSEPEDEFDFYETPASAVHCFLPHLIKFLIKHDRYKRKILDPCAGNGAIMSALSLVHDIVPPTDIIGIELQEHLVDKAINKNLIVYHGDFLATSMKELHSTLGPVGTVVANYPYGSHKDLARQFLDKSFEFVGNTGLVCALLRTNWLFDGTVNCRDRPRYLKYEKNMPHMYGLNKRPHFNGASGSDATTYAWMVWDRADRRTVGTLDICEVEEWAWEPQLILAKSNFKKYLNSLE